MAVYLLHFEHKHYHAQHYMGSTEDLEERISTHRKGNGARLVQVFCEHGIDFVVARTWANGDRDLERALKRQKNGPRLCPICNPKVDLSA